MNFSSRVYGRERRGSAAQSPNGFSLIEVMIAMAVAGVLTYAISQMLVNSGRQATSIQSKGDFNSFINQMQGALNNTATCLAAINPPGKKLEFTVANPNTSTAAVTGQFVAAGNIIPFPLNATVSMGGVAYGAPVNGAPPAGVTTTFGGPSTAAGTTSRKALKITQLQIPSVMTAGTQNLSQFVAPITLTVDRSVTGDTAAAVGGNTLTKNFSLLLTLDLKNPDPASVISGQPSAYPVIGCSAQFSDYWVSTNDNDILFSGGAVGIGVCSTGTGCVDPPTPVPAGVVGPLLDVAGKINASAYLHRSDARLKENVRDIPQALDRVLKLHGVIFDWKAHRDPVGDRDQLGFIAQEVEKVFPEVVNTDQTGMKSVGYANLLAPVIEAFKQQEELIGRQQREIAELKEAVLRQKGRSQ